MNILKSDITIAGKFKKVVSSLSPSLSTSSSMQRLFFCRQFATPGKESLFCLVALPHVLVFFFFFSHFPLLLPPASFSCSIQSCLANSLPCPALWALSLQVSFLLFFSLFFAQLHFVLFFSLLLAGLPSARFSFNVYSLYIFLFLVQHRFVLPNVTLLCHEFSQHIARSALSYSITTRWGGNRHFQN